MSVWRFFSSFCIVFGVPGGMNFRDILKRVWFFYKRGYPRFRKTVQRFGPISRVGDTQKALKKRRKASRESIVFKALKKYVPNQFFVILVCFWGLFWSSGATQNGGIDFQVLSLYLVCALACFGTTFGVARACLEAAGALEMAVRAPSASLGMYLLGNFVLGFGKLSSRGL